MNKMILSVVLSILALPALAAIETSIEHRFEKADPYFNFFHQSKDVCLAPSDAGTADELLTPKVEEIKVVYSKSNQIVLDETFLLKEALLESQASLSDSKDVNNTSEQKSLCWLQDRLTEKIQVSLEIPKYLGERGNSETNLPSVPLQLDVNLKTLIPC